MIKLISNSLAAALLLWSAALLSASAAQSSSSSQVRQWNSGAHHRHTNSPTGAAAAAARIHHRHRRRELTTDEQLDVLKLGFVPATKSWDDVDDDEEYTARSGGGITQFNNRGGNLDDSTTITTTTSSVSARIHIAQFIPTLSPLAFASTMALLAGLSHTLCFTKFACYASMMTGNVITMSMAISEQRWSDAIWKCNMIGAYIMGAVIVRSIELWSKQKQQRQPESNNTNVTSSSSSSSTQHLKLVAPLVLLVFAIAQHQLFSFGGTSSTLSSTSSSKQITSLSKKLPILALGYGMVYASATSALNMTITQLMTGHITKLGTALADRFIGPIIVGNANANANGNANSSKQWNKGTLTSVCIVSSCIIGGIVGAIIMERVEDGSVPLFGLLGMVYALVLAMY